MEGDDASPNNKKAEIDTSAPFRSVKEAIMLFGERVLAGEIYTSRLKEDRGKVNAKIQSERCEDECDEAVLLKCGFRMLGADLLNDTKMLEINNGAKELNIPTSDANRKLVASDNGGLQNPSYLIFNPVWDSKGAPSPNKRFNYPSVPGVQKPISDEDIAFMTVLELGQLIKTKQISSEELTKIFLKRLKRYNPVLEAVITFTEELAYKQAKEADHLLSQGVYLDIIPVLKHAQQFSRRLPKHLRRRLRSLK
nr:PREDICTED: uncharacterized protein LOC108213151 [Daucus carota subsp. sativus]